MEIPGADQIASCELGKGKNGLLQKWGELSETEWQDAARTLASHGGLGWERGFQYEIS